MSTKSICIGCTRDYRSADDCYGSTLCVKEIKQLQAENAGLREAISDFLRHKRGPDIRPYASSGSWATLEQALQGKKGSED